MKLAHVCVCVTVFSLANKRVHKWYCSLTSLQGYSVEATETLNIHAGTGTAHSFKWPTTLPKNRWQLQIVLFQPASA